MRPYSTELRPIFLYGCFQVLRLRSLGLPKSGSKTAGQQAPRHIEAARGVIEPVVLPCSTVPAAAGNVPIRRLLPPKRAVSRDFGAAMLEACSRLECRLIS